MNSWPALQAFGMCLTMAFALLYTNKQITRSTDDWLARLTKTVSFIGMIYFLLVASVITYNYIYVAF